MFAFNAIGSILWCVIINQVHVKYKYNIQGLMRRNSTGHNINKQNNKTSCNPLVWPYATLTIRDK